MDKQIQHPEITDEIKKSWPRSRLARSSGGVAFRSQKTTYEIEVALIATRGGERWQLPKGSREAGGLPLVYLLKTLIPLGAILLALQGVSLVCHSLVTVMGAATGKQT